MKNFIQPGKHLTIASSPFEARSGDLIELGDVVGVAIKNASPGEELVLSVDGVFYLPKIENQNIEAFRKLSLDAGRLTQDTTKGKICAFSIEEGRNPSTHIKAKLFGFSLPAASSEDPSPPVPEEDSQ